MLRRTEHSGYFRRVPFSLPLQEQNSFYPVLTVHAPGGKCRSALACPLAPHDSVPLKVLTLSCPHGASSSWSLMVPVPLPQHWLHKWFLLLHLCCRKPGFTRVLTCLPFQSCGQRFVPCPPLSPRSKKSCWFFRLLSVLLVGLNGDFQAPYRGIT